MVTRLPHKQETIIACVDSDSTPATKSYERISVFMYMNNLKRCPKCKQDLDWSLFNIRRSAKDGLQSWCKNCHRSCQNNYYRKDSSYKERLKASALKERARKRKLLLDYLKDKKCVICKESDPIVLDFDHIDPKTKNNEIGNMMRSGYAWDAIKLEMLKCQIICANCHRRKTAKQNNWYKYTNKL